MGEVVNVFNPPLLSAKGLLAPLGKCSCRAGKGCCYFVLSPSGQGGGMDGAGVTRGGFFPGCQVKQVGSETHLMLQPFTVTGNIKEPKYGHKPHPLQGPFVLPGQPHGGFVRGRTKPKVSDEKYGSGTQLPRCWRVPGTGAGSCLAGRC